MAKRDKIKPNVRTVVSFTYPTSDDWFPNLPRNTVQVSMFLYENPDRVGHWKHNHIKINVSGADDTCMARYEDVAEQNKEARVKELVFWLENKLPNPLTMEWLRKNGFQYD